MVALIEHLQKECDTQATKAINFFLDETRLKDKVRLIAEAGSKKEDGYVYL
jgi:hypothetical protein